jgi:hypothetical protein
MVGLATDELRKAAERLGDLTEALDDLAEAER